MTAMTEVKQPNFLMMKRVWLAIALPVCILLLGGLKPFAEFVWVWGFVSLFLLMFAYKKFRIKKGRVRQGGVNSEPAFRLGNVCVMR